MKLTTINNKIFNDLNFYSTFLVYSIYTIPFYLYDWISNWNRTIALELLSIHDVFYVILYAKFSDKSLGKSEMKYDDGFFVFCFLC